MIGFIMPSSAHLEFNQALISLSRPPKLYKTCVQPLSIITNKMWIYELGLGARLE